MSDTPKFAATPRVGYGRTTAALDNTRAVTTGLPTGAVEIITGGTNGSQIDRLKIVNIDTVGTAIADTPQVFRFFLFDGTNYRLVHEVASATIAAPTTSVAGYQQTEFFNPPLNLPSSSWKLLGGITKRTNASADVDFFAFGGDF